jgi:colanic acid/amylovoran biosynthesis glycosyltransferase
VSASSSPRAAAGDPPVVLHSTGSWLPQTETWLYTQVHFLPGGVENHIACERTENLDQFPQPRIHCMADQPAWRSLRDRALRKFRIRHHRSFLDEAARDSRAALMHSHFGFKGWRDMAVAKKRGLVHAVTFYGADVQFYPRLWPVWRERYREMFGHLDAVLCEGPHMGREIAALGCPPEKIRVHHLGIDLSLIPFEPRTWSPGEPLRVLLSGSFREKKGFPDAIEALGRIQSEADLQITLIGDATGEERSIAEKRKIEAAIARHALGDRITMMGFQPYRTVMETARKHHLFVSPSVTASDGDTEGGAPVSLIEMSASGMMIASTTHCDIPGVILDEESGLLSPERDPEALAANLRRMIAAPEAWDGAQRAGRAHIEAEFDARRQGERLDAIYRELITARDAGERN